MNNLTEKIRTILKLDDASSGKRNQFIDAMKGVAILLVVIAHTIQINNPDYDNALPFRIVASTAMPLFMFLAGLIISSQLAYSLTSYLKKNALRLVVPFLSWYLISYLIVGFHQGISLTTYLIDLVKYPDRGAWFLWVLFLNSTILYCVLKIMRIKNLERWENYAVIGAIIATRALSTDLLALAMVKQYFLYYSAGFFVYKYIDVLKRKRKIIYALAVVFFPILVLGWKRNAFPLFYPALLQLINDPHMARFIVSIYKYAVSFLGIIFTSFVLERIKASSLYPVLCWLGTLTLDIYLSHGYFRVRLGDGPLPYFSVFIISLAASLALSLLVFKRFKITRLLLLGQAR